MHHYKLKGNYEDFYDLAELLAKKAVSSQKIDYGVYKQLKKDYSDRLIASFIYEFTIEGTYEQIITETKINGVEYLNNILNQIISEIDFRDYALVLNEFTSRYGITLTAKQIGNLKNKNVPSVFISHSSNDKTFAQKIANSLISDGIKVWLDEAEIKVGESLIQKISESISEMEFLVVILSKNSINSNWVKKELDIAITLELQYNKLKILPIIIESCSLPITLLGKLYLDFSIC